MAIQNRRGSYTNFDPDKMVAGEFAVVRDGDPNSSTGRSVYLCFEPGVVKRLADYEDIGDMVAEVAEEYIQDFDDAVSALTDLIPDTEQAKDDATAAAEAANEAAEAASAVSLNGNSALGHAYGVCSTAYSTNPKIVNINGYQLTKGGLVSVRFVNGSSNLDTMNINGTGATAIRYRNITNNTANIGPDDTVIFQYNGTDFYVVSIQRADPLNLNCGTISSLPATFTNNFINRHMVCIKAVLGTPSAQTSDWTVETADKSVTISGTISGSTTLSLILEQARATNGSTS